MRSALLLLAFALPLAGAEPSVKPRVTLGTTALLAKGEALSAIFSPDSRRVGLIEAGGLRYWTLSDGQPGGDRSFDLAPIQQRITVASDGRTFFSIALDKEKYGLHCYDPEQEAPRRIAIGARFDSLLMSESGRHIAVETDGTVRILQSSDGAEITQFVKIDSLRRFSASRDGKSFAFSNRDGEVFVRSAGGPSWSPRISGKHRTAAVAMTDDGSKVATASYLEDEASGRKIPGPVGIWSMADQKLIATCAEVEWFAEFPNRLRFTPDDKMLLAGDGAYLRGWSVATGKTCFAVEPGWNYPGPLIVSPDSRYVAVTYAKRAMVWELATGKAPRGFEGHSGAVWDISFSPDGKQVATSRFGLAHITVWNTTTNRALFDANSPFARPPAGTTPPTAQKRDGQTEMKSPALVPGRVRLLFSPDGRRLATVNEATGAAGPIRLWDTTTGRKLWEIPVSESIAPEVVFTRTGLLAAHSPKPIHYDLDRGTPTWTCEAGMQTVGVKVNRRGTLAVIEEKNGAKNAVIDAATGKVVDYTEGVPHAFTPDGRSLVAIKVGPGMTNGFFNDFIVTRDLHGKKDGKLHKVPMGTAVGRLSPDGEFRVVVAEANGTKEAFLFRELIGDRPVCTMLRVDGKNIDDPRFGPLGGNIPHRPTAFNFSPDNRLFAAVYATGLLAVWDTATGDLLHAIESNCVAPKFVAFAPDSRTVFTSSGEGAGGPVYGFDTAAVNDPKAPNSLGGSPLQARRAIFDLAAQPAAAFAAANAVFAPATDADQRQYDAWIARLGSGSFGEREAATKGLSEAGWRVEAKLKAALATATSEEARQRLTDLLSRRDVRQQRTVHLLELLATDDAKALLAKIAATTPETFTAREARRALARIAAP